MELSYVDNEIKDLCLEVKEGDELKLNFAAFLTFPKAKIIVKVGKNASANIAFADFSEGDGTLKVEVNLDGEGASCEWHSSSLTKGQSKKVLDTSIFHNAPRTSGEMSNYGITLESSRLTFTGVSKIEKGSKESSTHQAAKIIVFDSGSDGKCSPILKIDENDVSASHSAIVGKLNESHLFYLESRGLPPKEAKRLITLGYLRPVLAYFSDEKLKNRINDAIERSV